MKKIFSALLAIACMSAGAQQPDSAQKKTPDKKAIKFNLNESGTHYMQATFLNQTWVRFDESNDGTQLFSKNAPTTFDIGLRRTRIQLFGQITDRTFIYFQYGQNNFNNTAGYAGNGNRKIAAFFHDALCEYKLSKGNQLKIGGGLTVMNGLSRFSQPSIGTIMTLDVPVFLQYTVDQIDQFDRRLAIYARGQVSRLDYRVYIANPFPVNSNGLTPPALTSDANFVNPMSYTATTNSPGINNQFGGYFAWNFFENETHTTPYMTGTYLGDKKIWNIAVGGVYQHAATNRTETVTVGSGTKKDTVFDDMLHLSIESYLDMPLNKEKGSAISAFAGFYSMNYGKNYLRYNGLMNPATGAASTATNLIASNAYGNSIPMFGTGQVVYTQVGILLPKNVLGENNGQLMPFVSAQYANYDKLQNKTMLMFDAGLNWLISGHRAKLSLDYQNRPTFFRETNGDVGSGARKSCFILQYQISI